MVREKKPCPKCGREFKNVNWHQRMSDCGESTSVPVTADQLSPGTIIHPENGLAYKTKWTRKQIWDRAEADGKRSTLIENPAESMSFSVHGVQWVVVAGVDIELPPIVADAYRKSLKTTGPRTIRPSGGTVQERTMQVTSGAVGVLEPIEDEV